MSTDLYPLLTSRLADDQLEISEVYRDTRRDNLSLCVYKGRQCVVHHLADVPENLRVHIEFECSRLEDATFLPRVYETVYADNQTTIVRQFAPGESLADAVRRGKHYATQQIISIARSLLQCLQELHEIGLEHLDVCAKNLIIAADGTAQLIRSSYVPSAYQQVSLESAFCCSPEQAGSIDRDVAAASDLYSSGVLLYLMITGQYPFPGDSVGDVLLAHMTQPVPAIESPKGVTVPRVLQSILNRLLQKDPTDRYQSAAAVIHDLSQLATAFDQGDADPSFSIGLLDHRESIVASPVLIGREEEIASFRSVLQQARSESNALTYVEGVSGSGKSRTIEEFSRIAAESGWKVFRGQCIQESSRRSLAAMHGVMEDFAGRIRDQDFDAKFRQQFDGEWNDLHVYFPNIEIFQHDDTSHESSVRPINEQRCLRTLSSFLNSIGSETQPALVVLDDCQWAEELTFRDSHPGGYAALNNVDKQQHHVMVVVASFDQEEVPQDHQVAKTESAPHASNI